MCHAAAVQITESGKGMGRPDGGAPWYALVRIRIGGPIPRHTCGPAAGQNMPVI